MIFLKALYSYSLAVTAAAFSSVGFLIVHFFLIGDVSLRDRNFGSWLPVWFFAAWIFIYLASLLPFLAVQSASRLLRIHGYLFQIAGGVLTATVVGTAVDFAFHASPAHPYPLSGAELLKTTLMCGPFGAVAAIVYRAANASAFPNS